VFGSEFITLSNSDRILKNDYSKLNLARFWSWTVYIRSYTRLDNSYKYNQSSVQ